MSETHPVYHAETTPLGYMPLPEVYSALDFVLNTARGESAAAGAGNAFLKTWLQAGPLPSKDAIERMKLDMGEQVAILTDALEATLQAFVDQLDSHPSPMPGTPFGDYYADLVQLQGSQD